MTKPNYGIDAPAVIRNLYIAGAISLILTLIIIIHPIPILQNFGWPYIGTSLITAATLMIVYSTCGKLPHRDRMLNMIQWRGNEQVLDIGTGNGVLMIGVAKKLSTGKSIGIDIWKQSDLTNNNVDTALRNAQLEGVESKVEIKNISAEKMSFADNTFDVVVSNLCLHNIHSKTERGKACEEIARVLKPGGVALISDFVSTGLYAKAFKEAGLKVEKFGPYVLTFPWLRIIKATKPV